MWTGRIGYRPVCLAQSDGSRNAWKRRTSVIWRPSEQGDGDLPRRWGRLGRMTRTARCDCAASAVHALSRESTELLDWCHSNGAANRSLAGVIPKGLLTGVPDVGTDACKFELRESKTGDRGIYAVSDIAKGEVILSIPLKLTLVEPEDEKLSDNVVYEGAHWQVRLACRLLREKALGKQSSWFTYIQTLPRKMPSIVHSCYEDIRAIQYEAIQKDLYMRVHRISEAWHTLKPEAHSNSTRDDFDWAMSVVQSRSYGLLTLDGFYITLAPLADLFNHAEYCDVPPSESRANELALQIEAIEDIPAQKEISISYGEKNNDSFFLAYSFIPPLNPEDDYILFNDVQDMIDWYCHRYFPEEIAGLIRKKMSDALAEMKNDVLQVVFDLCGNEGARDISETTNHNSVSLTARGDMSRLATEALEALSNLTKIPVQRTIAQRCWELLSMKSDLLDDLKILAESSPDTDHNFRSFHRRYKKKIERFVKAGHRLPVTPWRLRKDVTLSHAQKLTKTFDAYKKMILWNAILDAEGI